MSFSLHSRRFRVSLGPESSLLVTTVALSALWVLEFSAPRHVWPRLVIATVALLATWKGLRRGLEPFLLELRPNYDTLHFARGSRRASAQLSIVGTGRIRSSSRESDDLARRAGSVPRQCTPRDGLSGRRPPPPPGGFARKTRPLRPRTSPPERFSRSAPLRSRRRCGSCSAPRRLPPRTPERRF